MNFKRNILVTSALPYANGNLHLGHMLEFIQCDIWVRYHKLIGNNCVYISGIDAHGTPIMLNAKSNNISPSKLASMYRLSHISDLNSFFIDIDSYYTTHSIENYNLSRNIFNDLRLKNYIYLKKITQYYDKFANIFLPDRYIKGKCPRCKGDDQYGDFCEICNFKYEAYDLIDPISVVTGSIPILKESNHYFFSLDKFNVFLYDWCKNNITQKQILNKLNEWFVSGLKNWDITRDHPYFGIKIPNESDKYLYVWLDAPLGYISIAKNLFSFVKKNIDNCWVSNKIELYHFIGKDIIYFHTLFWPAILKSCGYRLPTDVFAHGFLTINGKKMSKSTGNFITARDYLKCCNPEFLRYYYASKFNDNISDIDLNLNDFVTKINSDLIGKFVNIFSRSLKLLNKYSNTLSDTIHDTILFDKFLNYENYIKILYEKRMYSKIINIIMHLSDEVNLYMDSKKPWLLKNNISDIRDIKIICTTVINLFLVLLVNIKPILPVLSKEIESILDIESLNWENLKAPIFSKKIKTFDYLMKRIKFEDINFLCK